MKGQFEVVERRTYVLYVLKGGLALVPDIGHYKPFSCIAYNESEGFAWTENWHDCVAMERGSAREILAEMPTDL